MSQGFLTRGSCGHGLGGSTSNTMPCPAVPEDTLSPVPHLPCEGRSLLCVQCP